LAVGCGDGTVTAAEAARQVEAMTPSAARAVALLPPLGEDRSGPLAQGRLSAGHVGDAIRAIQALVKPRAGG
jgi:hypothetical protein